MMIHVKVTRGFPAAPERGRRVVAFSNLNAEKNFLGEDFGARDPTAGELASNFCEKVLGNWDTEHVIRAPDAIGAVIGLPNKQCSEATAVPLDERGRERLRQQVPGWKVVDVGGVPGIRHDWTAQGPEQAETLKTRIAEVAEAAGHSVTVTAVGSQVFAVLPSSLTELTENDFIVAAKINVVDFSDVVQKKRARFWA